MVQLLVFVYQQRTSSLNNEESIHLSFSWQALLFLITPSVRNKIRTSASYSLAINCNIGLNYKHLYIYLGRIQFLSWSCRNC